MQNFNSIFLNILLTCKLEHMLKFSYLHLCTFIKTGFIFDAFCMQSQHTMPFMKCFYHIHTPNSKFTCCLVGGEWFRFETVQNLLKRFIFLFILHACPAFLKHSQKETFFHADMKKFLLWNSDKGVPEDNWNKKNNFENFQKYST